jgi:hypothetical protein
MAESEQLAGWRDSTLIATPGRPEVLHLAVTENGEDYYARCAPGRTVRGPQRCRPLDPNTLKPAIEVHPNGRCRHPGCRAKWPAGYRPSR